MEISQGETELFLETFKNYFSLPKNRLTLKLLFHPLSHPIIYLKVYNAYHYLRFFFFFKYISHLARMEWFITKPR